MIRGVAMKSNRRWLSGLLALALVCLCAAAVAAAATPMPPVLMIVGTEEKITFDSDGRRLARPAGGDSVAILDIGTDPEAPRIITTLSLMNTIARPPTNVHITPDRPSRSWPIPLVGRRRARPSRRRPITRCTS